MKVNLSQLLSGHSGVFINAGQLVEQLMTELPEDQAREITSDANAIDAVLAANPAIDAHLSSQNLIALAAVFGHGLNTINGFIKDNPDKAERYTAKLNLIQQVLRLSQIEITSDEDKAVNEALSGNDGAPVETIGLEAVNA